MDTNSRDIVEYGSSGSFHVGQLPEGCRRCIQGEKLVLYTTGSCGVGCYYCTIAHERRHRDSVFVNEVELAPDATALPMIYRESELCLATGAGVTGGDPLMAPERTITYIRSLKNRFGDDFHIHLYNSGEYLDDELLDQLVDAGLDEIRFHPKHISTQSIWEKAGNTKSKYPSLIVGFEIPAIPNATEQIKELISHADQHNLDFVNLNEFEFTESNFPKLDNGGFKTVWTGAAVVGSAVSAREIISSIKDTTSIPIHFCSSASKDSIQLVQRFKRRASQVARPFESISEEGELEYGRFTVFDPSELKLLVELLMKYYDVPSELLEVSSKTLSIDTSWIILEELVNDLREDLPDLQAEIIVRHPVDNGPITWIDPR